MSVKESIIRILREEFNSTSIPLKVRRRLGAVDELFIYLMDKIYRPEKFCEYTDSDEFIEVVISAVIERMYYNYFSDVDDLSDEWTHMYIGMQKYLTEKYGNMMKQYYEKNCTENKFD